MISRDLLQAIEENLLFSTLRRSLADTAPVIVVSLSACSLATTNGMLSSTMSTDRFSPSRRVRCSLYSLSAFYHLLSDAFFSVRYPLPSVRYSSSTVRCL